MTTLVDAVSVQTVPHDVTTLVDAVSVQTVSHDVRYSRSLLLV